MTISTCFLVHYDRHDHHRNFSIDVFDDVCVFFVSMNDADFDVDEMWTMNLTKSTNKKIETVNETENVTKIETEIVIENVNENVTESVSENAMTNDLEVKESIVLLMTKD